MPDFDYHDALIQIEMLFQSHILSFGYKEYSLETFADKKYFSDWKGRERCADTDEMRAGLNIDGILREENPSDTEVLTYLQYTLNIAELCRRSFNAEETPGYEFDIRNYTELLSRIRELLKRLNYDAKYVQEKDYIYLVPHDPALDAVEADEQNPVTALITEYRSSAVSGQLDKKKDILKQLGDTVAEYDDNTKGAGGRLYRRIEFLLESFNIEKGEETEEHPEVSAAIAKMNPQEVENWYDETYQLLLLRVLEHSNQARMQRVEDFAEKCGVENLEITEEEMAQLLSVKGVPEPPEKEDEKYPKLEDPEKEEAKLEKSEARDRERRSHTLRNVIVAIIIADVLFVLFVLCYLFLR